MATLDDIRQLFFVECEEQLEQLTDGLVQIEASEPGATSGAETINTMFRAVHSIKGGAASFSLDAIMRFAHAFETVLSDLREDLLILDADLVRAFYGAADYLAELIAMGAAGEAPDAASLDAQIAAMAARSVPASMPVNSPAQSFEALALFAPGTDAFAGFTPVTLNFAAFAPPEEPQGFVIVFRPTMALFMNGHEPARLFEEIEQLGALTVEARLDADHAWDIEEPRIEWTLTLTADCSRTQIEEIFEFAKPFAALTITPLCDAELVEPKPEDEVPTPAAAPIAVPQSEPTASPTSSPTLDNAKVVKPTVRVDLDLVDDLINLVGELVITQSVMTQTILSGGMAGNAQLANSLEEFKSLTRQLQGGVMAIRAQSVKPLFQRMGRIVRETAQIAGKTVRFVTCGEDTEVDRTVIERLVDPLTHILRNAIDHGLEMPERRNAAHKDPTGTVTLSAAHRSGRVVIEVRDDGAGVDREKVLAAAIRKGLVPANAALGPAEIDRLLFMPGFSTAASVTSLSGRGVGMDVVNNEIRRLGGRVTISSLPGEGTTISISLPLTLAVLDGMIVDVAGQTMVVPIASIIETISPEQSQLQMVGQTVSMITVRGRAIPVIDLATLLGFDCCDTGHRPIIFMLVRDDAGECRALAIDGIYDQRQVVIKSLERNYGNVPFIAAATILGDGHIALILDLEEIIHRQAPSMRVDALQPNEVQS